MTNQKPLTADATEVSHVIYALTQLRDDNEESVLMDIETELERYGEAYAAQEVAKATTARDELIDCIFEQFSTGRYRPNPIPYNGKEYWPDANGWYDMECCKKDGNPVLAFFVNHGPLTVRWTDSDDDPKSKYAHWHTDDFKHGPYPIRGYVDTDVTGWQPLPAGPVEGG